MNLKISPVFLRLIDTWELFNETNWSVDRDSRFNNDANTFYTNIIRKGIVMIIESMLIYAGMLFIGYQLGELTKTIKDATHRSKRSEHERL